MLVGAVFGVIALYFPAGHQTSRPSRSTPSRSSRTSTWLTSASSAPVLAVHLRGHGHVQRGQPHRRPRRPGHRCLGHGARRVRADRLLAVPALGGTPTRRTDHTAPTCTCARPARDRDHRGRGGRGAARLPVVERVARPDLHGRHRLAGARWAHRGLAFADPYGAAPADPRPALHDHTVTWIIQISSYQLPDDASSGWCRCSTTSSWPAGARSTSSSGSGSSPGSASPPRSACSTPTSCG